MAGWWICGHHSSVVYVLYCGLSENPANLTNTSSSQIQAFRQRKDYFFDLQIQAGNKKPRVIPLYTKTQWGSSAGMARCSYELCEVSQLCSSPGRMADICT